MMRSHLPRALLVCFCMTLARPATANAPLRALEIKIYRSFDSDLDIKLELAALADTEGRGYLMRVSGASHRGSRAARFYHRAPSRAGERFTLAGTERTHLVCAKRRTLYQGSWREVAELHMASIKVNVIYDQQASRRADKQSIIDAYLSSQRLDLRDRKKVEAAIARSVAALRRACGNASFRATFDWTALQKRRLLHLAHASVNYLDPLTALCKTDVDYRDRIRKLKQARFGLASRLDQHRLRVSATHLWVDLAPTQPNSRLLARQWLQGNL